MTMHPSLATIPTPPDKRPYVPSVRGFRPTGHRVDLGYIPSDGVGPRPDPLPIPLGEPMHHSLAPRACPDCSTPFTPKAWNQVRCTACSTADRHAKATARKQTAKTRRSEPRSPVWLKGQATRKVNQATRRRARGNASATQRQVA